MVPHSPACWGTVCSLPDANVPDFICAKIFAGAVFELELLFDGAGDGVDTMLLNGDCPNGEKPVGSATLLINKWNVPTIRTSLYWCRCRVGESRCRCEATKRPTTNSGRLSQNGTRMESSRWRNDCLDVSGEPGNLGLQE